jgi:hypothetical protein
MAALRSILGSTCGEHKNLMNLGKIHQGIPEVCSPSVTFLLGLPPLCENAAPESLLLHVLSRHL